MKQNGNGCGNLVFAKCIFQDECSLFLKSFPISKAVILALLKQSGMPPPG
jgi:hypothetical protein